MSLVNSHNEWDPLEEIIVGSAKYARHPSVKDRPLHTIAYSTFDEEKFSQVPSGPYPQQILEETEEDLDLFAHDLNKLGITVRRPEPIDNAKVTTSPHWSADGYYTYCPRDSILVVGTELIEAPMVLRHRYFENIAYRKIFLDYLRSGSRWVSAPKPELRDELYDTSNASEASLTEIEPVFDAANIIRCGADLFYLVSNTGNKLGALWLQTHLGPRYRIHLIEGIYAKVHLDTTFLPLRPGLVLTNPARVKHDDVQDMFHKWDVLYAPYPVEIPFLDYSAPTSPWIGMNVLSLSPSLVAVEERQLPLMRILENAGFDVMPVRLRHCRTLGGGPHCVTLDTRRRGNLEDYFG
jgi:scyllo-inosamine-4-phosphate amidinotransferase 1